MKIAMLLFFAGVAATALGATQPTNFGDRNEDVNPPAPEKAAPVAAAPVAEGPGLGSAPKPPPMNGVEWLTVSYDKAENEVLALFERDLPSLEKITKETALYEVRISGSLPQDYSRSFRSKLERVMLISKMVRLKDCPACEQSVLVRGEDGVLRFESSSTDTKRPARIAGEIGVNQMLFAELTYTPEDIQLRMRLVDTKGEVLWTREYSTADVVRTRQRYADARSEGMVVGEGDSLSRIVIGEIAFTTVVSTGVMMLPPIGGGGLSFYPSFDILIGEKYDRGKRRFGFVLGAAANVNPGGGPKSAETLPWAARIAPTFRHTFNPYNVTSVKWSLSGEAGAFASSNLVTGYLGLGPEMMMMERFSLSFIPMYIIPATVGSATIKTQNEDGSFSSGTGADKGRFGGFAFMMKANINW